MLNVVAAAEEILTNKHKMDPDIEAYTWPSTHRTKPVIKGLKRIPKGSYGGHMIDQITLTSTNFHRGPCNCKTLQNIEKPKSWWYWQYISTLPKAQQILQGLSILTEVSALGISKSWPKFSFQVFTKLELQSLGQNSASNYLPNF